LPSTGPSSLAGAAVSRVLRHQIYGLHGLELPTYVAAGAVLMAFGLAATWWPVRQAVTADLSRTLNAN